MNNPFDDLIGTVQNAAEKSKETLEAGFCKRLMKACNRPASQVRQVEKDLGQLSLSGLAAYFQGMPDFYACPMKLDKPFTFLQVFKTPTKSEAVKTFLQHLEEVELTDDHPTPIGFFRIKDYTVMCITLAKESVPDVKVVTRIKVRNRCFDIMTSGDYIEQLAPRCEGYMET